MLDHSQNIVFTRVRWHVFLQTVLLWTSRLKISTQHVYLVQGRVSSHIKLHVLPEYAIDFKQTSIIWNHGQKEIQSCNQSETTVTKECKVGINLKPLSQSNAKLVSVWNHCHKVMQSWYQSETTVTK